MPVDLELDPVQRVVVPWWASSPRIASTTSDAAVALGARARPALHGQLARRLGGVVAADDLAAADVLAAGEVSRHLSRGERAAGVEEAAVGPAAGQRRGPGMPTTACLPSRSGTARSSRRVYGCRGAVNSWSRVPVSTIRPGVHHRDAVGSSATTARSWLT